MTVVALTTVCTYHSQTDSADLWVKVQRCNYDLPEETREIFFERRVEILHNGGSPARILQGLLNDALKTWTQTCLNTPSF